MTLGEKIRQLRKDKGLSQEKLAEMIGVSRQAVFKWEQNLSYPDTANLLAIAQIFGVSADELANIKITDIAAGDNNNDKTTKHSKNWLLITGLILFLIAVILIVLSRSDTDHLAIEAGTVEEFTLIWQNEGEKVHLTIGEQGGSFPWGVPLTATEMPEIFDTDFSATILHNIDCGALFIEYFSVNDEAGYRESVAEITTITEGYSTPRGIAVGSHEGEVLNAYDNELIYIMKEHGSDLLCVHDYKYAYAPAHMGGCAIEFYIDDHQVAGIKVKTGDDMGNEAYAIDNIWIFPVKDGQPDFSLRQDPETEDIDANRTIYIALYALENDKNLDAEEIYRYRQDIYENLPDCDWQTYGYLGPAEQATYAQEMLLNWLIKQDELSADNIRYLLMGACRSNLDGWMTDSYSIAMAKAFINYTETYVKLTAGEDFSYKEQENIVILTAYGCAVPESTYQQAREAINDLIYHSGALNAEEQRNIAQAFLASIEDSQ